MQSIIAKARAIKLFILDVDGVLTDGTIYYGKDGIEMKGFHIYDGFGIKLLQKTGVEVAIISGKNSDAVRRRLEDLKLQHVYLGHEDKLIPYAELKQKLQLRDHAIAYMGDDLLDLPILCRAGLSISVPQAPRHLHQHVDLITNKKGGKGAVREACEFIMEAQGTFHSMVQSYIPKEVDEAISP
jgi:3-deoxy-D-manno-octulosonate 8-phosphate phosphatase (KDO 8-P phosphatase)